jgi:hypothetical protein
MRYQDENIWLTQKMMGVLYGVETNTINYHIKKIFEDHELGENSVIRNFRITAADGKSYDTKHYNLQMIIAVGFKFDKERAVQFRKWANDIIKQYTIQAWVMDDARIIKGGTILTDEYFERQLERIRLIRLSERKFYQKITDIYATALDYDKDAAATLRFFASVQNKVHYAVHGNTAAELIVGRADSTKAHMGLTSWENSPDGMIQKQDVVIAKNYLTEDEITMLGRMVNSYLELAEGYAKRKIPMTMADWEERLAKFLTLWSEREVLKDSGKVSAEIAKQHVETEFEKYRIVQDKLFESDFDKYMLKLTQQLELKPAKG